MFLHYNGSHFDIMAWLFVTNVIAMCIATALIGCCIAISEFTFIKEDGL